MADPSILRSVPMLAVKEMSRSLAFYERLGFSTLRWQDGDGYAFLSRDGHELLHLSQSDMVVEGRNPGNGVYFYLRPGTAAPLEAELRAAGLSILSPLAVREWRMQEFVLADPDGNLLRFGEPA